MPIGSEAQLVPVHILTADGAGIDHERFYRLSSADKLQPILPPSGWEKRWPGDSSKRLGTIPIPDDLIVPDARKGYTPNECCAFVLPDGHSLVQLEPTCRAEKGMPIIGYPRYGEDLFGDGILGVHWGSGLSAIGGSIRLGELTSPLPIRHALKINLWGKNIYFGSDLAGFKWPADRHDDGAARSYQGTDRNIVMGCLFALAPRLTPQGVGIRTPLGRKLFQAFQDYGAYLSDDAGWNHYDLCCEFGVCEEVRKAFGIEMDVNSGDYFSDLIRIVGSLSVVANNGPKSVGGGGVPRRPLAPPLQPVERR